MLALSGEAAGVVTNPINKAALYQAGFDASWEIDVFGGTRRAIESAGDTLAAQLTAVMQSNPLPIALVAVVDDRLTAARVRALRAALLTLGHSAAEADTLGQLHLKGFVPPQLPGRAAAR